MVILWRVCSSCGGMARCFVGRKADSQSALFGNSPVFAGAGCCALGPGMIERTRTGQVRPIHIAKLCQMFGRT